MEWQSSEYTSFRSSSLKTSKRSSNEPFLPFHGSGNTIPLFLRQTLNTLCVRKAPGAHSCVKQCQKSLCKPSALSGAVLGESPNPTLGTLSPQHSPCQLGDGNAITISTGRIITPSTTLELHKGETRQFLRI